MNVLIAATVAITVVTAGVTAGRTWPGPGTWGISALKLFALWCLAFLPGWLYVRFLDLRAKALWSEYVLNLHRLGWDLPWHLPGAPGGVRVLPGVGEGPARPPGRQHLPAEVRGLLRAPDHQHRPGRELPGQERVAVPGVPGDRGVRRRLGRGAVGHPVRHRPVRPVGRAEVRVPRRLRLRDQHAHPPLLPERPAPERLRHRGVPDHPGAAHRHRAAPGTGWRHRGHRAGRARRRLRRRLLPARRPAGPAAGDVPGPALVRPAGHLGIPARPARRVQPVVRGAAHRRGRRGHAEPHHDEPRRRDPAHPGPGRRWWTGPTRPSC